MTFTHTSYAVLSLRANRVITSVGDMQALVALVLQQVTTSPPIDPLTINSWKYYNHNHGNGLLFFYQDHYSQVSLLRPCDFDIVLLAFQFKFSGSKGVMGTSSADQRKIVTGDNGYVLEDVPHLSDYIPDLPQSHNHLNTMGRTSYYKITTGVILRCITQVPKSKGRVLARRRFRCAPWDFGGLGNLEAIDGDFILKLCYATWTLLRNKRMNLSRKGFWTVGAPSMVTFFVWNPIHAKILMIGIVIRRRQNQSYPDHGSFQYKEWGKNITYPNPLQDNHSYSAVKQYFVNEDDTVAQQIIVYKNSPGGTHFRRVGPRQKVYFESDEVRASIVTCGGLCPGINTVIREIVCGLYYMYGVNKVLGIEGGYRGFYSRNTIPVTPKVVNDIHKRGGTILGTSRGGHETSKIVDSIQDRGITQEYMPDQIQMEEMNSKRSPDPKYVQLENQFNSKCSRIGLGFQISSQRSKTESKLQDLKARFQLVFLN
ncbi:hypothetical protein TEA_002451 [Camellia sinensis var. sinensis]|uniref:Phosphofructokinase domain-containing protein n=1 Tax=Camellia sinensis var. sinensis TaxID=542762 RepID=A0A4S4DCQ2_CAMSN|nr:hypothetical protein TEA_002451 [Camellia sinensis var. sinensis]